MEKVDYLQVNIPKDKPKDEFTCNERRADIVKMMEEKGHPWGFNRSNLAEDYGVSAKMVCKDFDVLKKYYLNQVGRDAKKVSEMAYRKIVREHMKSGEYEKARKALESWNKWLQSTGDQKKEPEKVEVSSPSEEDKEQLKDYADILQGRRVQRN